MNGKLLEFDIPIYNHPVTVVVGDKQIAIDFLREKMEPISFLDCRKSIENASGYALHADTGGGAHCFIWVPDIDDSYDILVHETLHASFYVLGYVGVPADNKAHEALCYLQGYLLEQIKTRFNKAKPYVAKKLSKTHCEKSSCSDGLCSGSALKVASHSRRRAMVSA